MNFLIDTHILIWSFIDPESLNNERKKILLDEENKIYYSQISLWEIALKFSLGKLKLKGMNPEEFLQEVDNSFFLSLKLQNQELMSFHRLPILHGDPFDRMLVWQSIQNDYTFISSDKTISRYREYGLKTA